MATDEGGELDLVMRRGVDEDRTGIYTPRNRTLPPFDISGQSVSLKIQPHGEDEIVITDTNPGIYVPNDDAGEVKLNIAAATKNAWSWQNAPYVIILGGKMFLRGTITMKNLYDR